MYKAEPTFTTKHGTKIVPLVPAQIRGEKKARYRLCQILPAKPQRLEWINVYNIVVHENGTAKPYEVAAEITLPQQRA